uniref:VWFA domain-containing protein n=1 Tax=Aureoumbra lagunensis TaxID=44058 RepID=A0A6S8DSE3_9STRA|mmetsp:Transcript_14611/g.22028  ORF Transcript_14611/g.22028 Transcript_14611/m.22028 type:complete len:462 (+) Transcript_14611:56-1441(+)
MSDREHFESWEKIGINGSWAGLVEDESGKLKDTNATEDNEEVKKLSGKRRIGKEMDEDDERCVARGLLRSLVCVLDASKSAGNRDFFPTRFGVTIRSLMEFVAQFLKENPVSTMGIVCAGEGSAYRISRLSSSIRTHVKSLEEILHKTRFSPRGSFSLVAAIDEALQLLRGTPDYGYREILIIVSSFGSLDATSISESLDLCQNFKVRISFISLVAETYQFKQVSKKTNGTYQVALDRSHLKKLLTQYLIPPKLVKDHTSENLDQLQPLVHMGFPGLKIDPDRAGIAISSLEQVEWTTTTYTCPRCATRVPRIPIDCPVCELPLVASQHLATYYHHLFPVPRFIETAHGEELPSSTDDNQYDEEKQNKTTCFGCFDPLPLQVKDACTYTCPRCSTTFCATCDDFIHDVLHVCPGCDSSAACTTYVPSSSNDTTTADAAVVDRSKKKFKSSSTPPPPADMVA